MTYDMSESNLNASKTNWFEISKLFIQSNSSFCVSEAWYYPLVIVAGNLHVIQ